MAERRIGRLDTPEKCWRECARVYRLASKGEIPWPDAQSAAAVLEGLSKMIAANGDTEHREVKWNHVGKNALHS